MERFGRETREFMVEELKSLFEKNPNIVVTTFSKLTVSDLQKLRVSLKNAAATYEVVKNSIIKRVLEEMKLNDILGMVDGMCGVVFFGGDPIAASKTIVSFKKDHETFEIKGGVLDGSVISFDRIKQLSALPPREVLLGMVVSGMYSPVIGFVNSLSGIIRKFVYVVNAIKEKGGKEDGGGKEGN